MQVTVDRGGMVVKRGSGPKIYSESAFFYELKRVLQKQGKDVIKKEMVKDGHMVSEDVYYVRSRNMNKPGAFMAWDGAYALRATYQPYNQDGVVYLSMEEQNPARRRLSKRGYTTSKKMQHLVPTPEEVRRFLEEAKVRRTGLSARQREQIRRVGEHENPTKKGIGVGYKRKVIHHPGTPGKREPWIEYKIVRSYTKKRNPGSVTLIVPLTRKAKFWVDRNVGLESWQWMGPGFAVEWRYVDNLVQGMEDSGLVKGKDFDVN